MRLRIQTGSVGGLGAVLLLTVLLVLAGRATGGDFPPGFSPEHFEIRTYAPHSTREIADCQVEKIFLDHRKMGFFKVKLLPMLVVQGVRVKFGGIAPTNEWAETFQSDWLPKVSRGGVEWRDVGISSQKAGAPCLHAGSAQPSAPGTTIVCVFSDVTLEACGTTWKMSQAELRNEDGHPCVVWMADGGDQNLDLFSGELVTHQKSNKTEK